MATVLDGATLLFSPHSTSILQIIQVLQYIIFKKSYKFRHYEAYTTVAVNHLNMISGHHTRWLLLLHHNILSTSVTGYEKIIQRKIYS